MTVGSKKSLDETGSVEDFEEFEIVLSLDVVLKVVARLQLVRLLLSPLTTRHIYSHKIDPIVVRKLLPKIKK